jgi:hypothetical protein
MVNTVQDIILTVNPERRGKSDSRLPTHPGWWFQRCRHTGEVQWVLTAALDDDQRAATVIWDADERVRGVLVI